MTKEILIPTVKILKIKNFVNGIKMGKCYKLTNRLGSEKYLGENERGYERDVARILHSSAFRRLQNKMQVLFLGDSDYYRTRLTHTLEVMQIARGLLLHIHSSKDKNEGICSNKLDATEQQEVLDSLPDHFLLEAICLAHDLGHPPFGHAGERALYQASRDKGGFEGNAQTFRILVREGNYGKFGLDLRRRTLLGVIKYPILYKNAFNKDALNNNRHKPPKCLYDAEENIFKQLLETFSEQDQEKFCETKEKQREHTKSKYKTLDASIMEMADDIAYACHDLEDSIRFGFFKQEHFEQFLEVEEIKNSKHIEIFKKIGEKLFPSSKSFSFKREISKIIHFFMTNIQIVKKEGFECPLFKYNIVLEEECRKIMKHLNKKIVETCIKHPKNTQLEFKGERIVKQLYEVFFENEELLPQKIQNKILQELQDLEKARIICDYISGMTDNYALKIYRRIFDAEYGSIADII